MLSLKNKFTIKLVLFFCSLFFSVRLFALKFNMTPGVTPVSQDIYDLHMTIFLICVAIGIIVFSVLFYTLVKHRKSKGHQAAVFHENTKLEIFWAIVPFIILIIMAIPATKVLSRMDDESKSEINIKITGYQWRWKYEYLDQGVSYFSNLATPYDQIQNKKPKGEWYLLEVDKPLVIPIHKKIRFLVTSNDVIHSWWVPALGIKRDAIPGFIYEAWAKVDRPGVYRGQCAELCGLNHGFMPIVVKAVTDVEYQQWLAQNGAQITPPPATTTPPTPTNAAPAVQPTAAIPSATMPVTTPSTVPTVPTTPAGTPTTAAATAPTTPPSTPVAPAAPSAVPSIAPAAAPTTTPTPAATTTAPTKMTKEDLIKQGQTVYQSRCISCHQENGQGMPPAFPPLKNSKIVTGPVINHIDTVLNGVIKDGKPTAMVPFRDILTDTEIAAVITYERNSWDNDKAGQQAGGIVQPSDVTTEKQKPH